MTLGQMLRLTVGSVGARFLGAGLGLLTQIALARLLTQHDVGVVLMAMSAAAFISLLVIGGHAMLASTELPKLIARGSRRGIAAFHAATLTDASMGLILAAVVVSGLIWLTELPDGVKLALGLGLASAPFSGLMRYNAMAANSHRRFMLSYLPDFLVRPVLFLAGVGALWLAVGSVGAVAVILVFVLGVAVVTIGQAALLGADGLLPRHWRNAVPRYGAVIRRRALALVVVSAVTLAFADIVTMLAGFVLPPDDVAVVGVAMRLAAIAGFVLQAAQQFILPDYAAAVARKDRTAEIGILWRVNGLTLAVIAAGLVGTLFLGRPVLHVFGEAYGRGSELLMLLMAGQSIRAMGGMNQSLLSLHGRQLRTASACVLALVVLVCLALLLSRSFGLAGFGCAVIAAELVWLVALSSQASALVGRRGDLLWLLRAKAGGQ